MDAAHGRGDTGGALPYHPRERIPWIEEPPAQSVTARGVGQISTWWHRLRRQSRRWSSGLAPASPERMMDSPRLHLVDPHPPEPLHRPLIRPGMPVEPHVYPVASRRFDPPRDAPIAEQARRDSRAALERSLAR